MSERYKRCIIDPRVYELRDGSGWTAEVYVAHDLGSEVIDYPFFLREKFDSREAALAAAISVGKKKVDKGLPDPQIASIAAEQTRLPSTHQRGRGAWTDDVAKDVKGPTKVP